MNADARFMRLEFRARQETHVIGGNRAYAARLCQFQRRFRANLFSSAAGALHFEIKPIAAIGLPAFETALSLIVAASRNRLTDVALKSSREHDQSLKRLAVQPAALQHRHPAMLALKIRTSHQLRQMPVTGEILAQENDA